MANRRNYYKLDPKLKAERALLRVHSNGQDMIVPRQKPRGLHGFCLIADDINTNVLRVMFEDKATAEQVEALRIAIQDYNRRN